MPEEELPGGVTGYSPERMVSGMHSCISDDVTLRAICAGSLWQFCPPLSGGLNRDPRYIESAVTRMLKTAAT